MYKLKITVSWTRNSLGPCQPSRSAAASLELQLKVKKVQVGIHIRYEECEGTYLLVVNFLVYNIPLCFDLPAQEISRVKTTAS